MTSPGSSRSSGSTRAVPARNALARTSARRSILGMSAVILLLHLAGWGTLALLVAPQQLQVLGSDGRAQAFGLGLGVTAYLLGMRHAFDADHIAAIDNTTRSLSGRAAEGGTAETGRPVSVGFWFSLGHSSVVMALCVLLTLGVRALVGPLQDESSLLHTVLGTVGPVVSGLFLWVIGVLNLLTLISLVRLWRAHRARLQDDPAGASREMEDELETQLERRGGMARILRPALRAVRRPWHMYPLGFLFGLGFDTATEISLLVLAGGAAALALPWYAILTLPVLFAAGMSLLDTLDGVVMSRAYGWALARPRRRLLYNVAVTLLSVAVALIIGTIELAGVVTERWGLQSGPIAWVGGIGLDGVGYVIVALFVLVWGIALIIARRGERGGEPVRTLEA